MSNLVIDEKIGEHIVRICFNRPEVANAMSHAFLEELASCVHKVNHDSTVRCVIITGIGEKAFCAGADLKERKGMNQEQTIAAVKQIGTVIQMIENIEVPVIAALNGVAYGGGLELALACDMRLIADHAKVGLTETSLAIIPGAGGTQRLSRLIGLGHAKQLIFTAQPITAQKAIDIGLVQEICQSSILMERAVKMATKIAANGPLALKQAKTAIQQGYQTDMTTGLEIEQLCYQATIPTHDRLRGLEAFKEKRKPIYKGE